MPRRNKKKHQQKRPKLPIVWAKGSPHGRSATFASRLEIESAVSQYLPRVLSEIVGESANEFRGTLVTVGRCRSWITLQCDKSTGRFMVIFQDASLSRFVVGPMFAPNELSELTFARSNSSLAHIQFFDDFLVFVDSNRLECLSISTRKRAVKLLNFWPNQLAVMHSRYVLVSAEGACCVFDAHTGEIDEQFTLNLSLRMVESDLALARPVLVVRDFIIVRTMTKLLVVLRGCECEVWVSRPDPNVWINDNVVAMGDDFIVGSFTSFRGFHRHRCLSVLRLSDRECWTFDFESTLCVHPSDRWPQLWCATCLIENATALAVSMQGWYFVFDFATGEKRNPMITNAALARSLVLWIDQTTVLVQTAVDNDDYSLYIWDTVAMTFTPVGEKSQMTRFQRLGVAHDGTVIAAAESSLLVFR